MRTIETLRDKSPNALEFSKDEQFVWLAWLFTID